MVFRPRPSNQIPPGHRPLRPMGNNLPAPTQGAGNIIEQFKQAKPALTDIASKGIGGMSKTLNNVQQVLRVVETTAPLIRQYGPLVKNLPAMLKMMKALYDADNFETGDSLESGELNQEVSSDAISPDIDIDNLTNETNKQKQFETTTLSQSKRKIYI